MPLDPEGGCRVEFTDAPATITVITHGALMTTLRSDSAVMTTAPRRYPPPDDLELRQHAADFTVPHTVNGVALRCLGADANQGRRNSFQNSVGRCVLDQPRALYLDQLPMVLYSNVQPNVPAGYAYNYIVEPRSVRRLPSGQPDPFASAPRAAKAAAR